MSKVTINKLKKQRAEWIRLLRQAKNPHDESAIKDMIDRIEEDMAKENV